MIRTAVAALAFFGALLVGTGTMPADAATTSDPYRKYDWYACKYEDGSGQKRCVWDARHMGNGIGQSFKVVTRDGEQHYTNITHRRAHFLLTDTLIDNGWQRWRLEYKGHEICYIKYYPTRIRCIDGYTES